MQFNFNLIANRDLPFILASSAITITIPDQLLGSFAQPPRKPRTGAGLRLTRGLKCQEKMKLGVEQCVAYWRSGRASVD